METVTTGPWIDKNTHLRVHGLPYDLPYALPGQRNTSLWFNPSANYLPVFPIRNADNRSLEDVWVRCQCVLNLHRGQILSPSNDEILNELSSSTLASDAMLAAHLKSANDCTILCLTPGSGVVA
jgi:hypothetical protein